MMKKRTICVLFALFLIVVICCVVNGVIKISVQQIGNKKNPNVQTSQITKEIESEYYDKTNKIEDSYLYMSSENDFLIQLPNDADLIENIEDYGGRLSCYSNMGHISIRFENRAYVVVSEEELAEIYANAFADDLNDYKIKNFRREECNGVEVGRSYSIVDENNNLLVYRRELNFNGNIICVIGQPAGDKDKLKDYINSFVLI